MSRLERKHVPISDVRFQNALRFVLEWETVFDSAGNPVAELDPADPGGLTKFGIDQRSHPAVNIRALTREGAAALYLSDYWLPVRASELPVPVGEVMFDIAVNNGRGRAIKWLQALLGVAIDGVIGPITLAAAAKADAMGIAMALLKQRETFYRDIGKGTLAKFLAGWLNRNQGLARFVMAVPSFEEASKAGDALAA